MSGKAPAPLVVGGWTLFAHPLFLDQLDALIRQVETLKQKDSVGYVKKNATKRLAAIAKLAFEAIPQDRPVPSIGKAARSGTSTDIGFGPSSFSNIACSSGITGRAG